MSARGGDPRRLPLSHRRAFVARHTRLRPVHGVEGVRLHLASEVEPLWRAVEEATGEDGAPIPFWAFAWAGGLALGAYVHDNPATVAGLHVLDMATGSGLVGIVAARAGAARVDAADIDPFAEAAVALNARWNHVHLTFVRRDLLDEPPPEVDVILAADTWYEGPLAVRMLPWLRAAAVAGTTVLVGDPGRAYLPDPATIGFERVSTTTVQTTTTLEDRAFVTAFVFRVLGQDGAAR
jgi:predicted nicotinamide N-methyase